MALSTMSKDPRIGSFPIKSFKPQPGGLLSLSSLIGPQDPSMPPPSSVQGFLPDYSKLSPEQEKVANAVAWGIRNTIKGDSPYKLSKIAQAEGLAPNLTCIGGACNLYKNLGLDFSVFGKEPGVRESDEGGTTVEYNPTFAKNYAKAGFIKLQDKEIDNDEFQKMLKAGLIKKGDIIQNVNETTGIPYHSNVVYDASGPNEEPRYTVYNAYKHSDAVLNGKNSRNDYYLYNPLDVPEFKNRKYNIFRLSDEKAKELVKADAGGKLSQSAIDISIDNEVKDIVKEITNVKDKASKSYLRETYGTEDFSRENIEKIADQKYLSKLKYQTDPAVWLRFNKGNPKFDAKWAQEMADEAKRKLEIYLKGQGYGVSPFTFQQTNRMKAALSK
jgi:hypothetical protein